MTFNLAFAPYAFVDVVCDALMVTEGRGRGRLGACINFQWGVLAIANATAVYMVALGIPAFPLSFFLYLDPDHPWWKLFDISVSVRFNPLPGWNRYQWFHLIVQTILGFASIPALIIPLKYMFDPIGYVAE